MSLTAESLLRADRPTPVGSMICLPRPPAFLDRGMKYLPNACQHEWFREVAVHVGLNGDRSPQVLLDGLVQHYGHIQVAHGREPGWIERIPPSVRHEVRRRAAINGSQEQVIEHAGVRFCVPHGSMFAHAEQVFNLNRLDRIRQLSSLRVPISATVAQSGQKPLQNRFPHNRRSHSRGVAAIVTLICWNVLREQIDPGTAAGVGHDTKTAAGGDMVHAIDRKAFNEDEHFAQLLVDPDFQAFLARWNLPGELIASTVAGKGLLGDILDWGDKSEYVSTDTRHYLEAVKENLPLWYPDGFLEIERMISRHPNACRIWEAARIHEGQLVCEDLEGLAVFLRLRMLLFRWIYLNPTCLCWEHAIAEPFIRPMYESGFVTREQLWSHDDRWLSLEIDRFLDRTPRFRSGLLEDLDPYPFGIVFEQYPTMEAALIRARGFNDDPSKTVVVDKITPATKTGANRFRVVKHGQVQTFAQAFPRETAELEALLRGDEVVSVAILDLPELGVPEHTWKKVKLRH